MLRYPTILIQNKHRHCHCDEKTLLIYPFTINTGYCRCDKIMMLSIQRYIAKISIGVVIVIRKL